MEKFEIGPGTRRLMRVMPWVLFFFSLLCVSLPFWLDPHAKGYQGLVIGFSAVGTVFFGVLSWVGWSSLRKMSTYPVMADQEGIWPAAMSRERGLVPWVEVCAVRERPYLQRLELVDGAGNVRMKLEYQLERFERVRELITQRAAVTAASASRSLDLSRSVGHHAFSLGMIAAVVACGAYIAPERPVLGLVCALGVGSVLVWEYLTTPHRLTLNTNTLTVHWPGRARQWRPAEIEAIVMGDMHVNQIRHPMVGIAVRGSSKPIPLRGLGKSATELFVTLSSWRESPAEHDRAS